MWSQAARSVRRRSAPRAPDRPYPGPLRLYPKRLAADSACGSAENLAWLVQERGIEPHIPSSTGRSGRMAPSSGPTSPSTMRPTLTSALPENSSGSARRPIASRPLRRCRWHAALPRQQVRLRCLRAQASMLSERASPQDPALHPRRRPRLGTRHRQPRCVRHLPPRTEEGGDAVRAPNAHPEGRPPAITRAKWRPRRVPARRHSPESPQDGQAAPDAGTCHGRVRAGSLTHPNAVAHSARLYRRLLQHNPPVLDVQ